MNQRETEIKRLEELIQKTLPDYRIKAHESSITVSDGSLNPIRLSPHGRRVEVAIHEYLETATQIQKILKESGREYTLVENYK